MTQRPASRLPLYHLLDPRNPSESLAAPIRDSVNMPADELRQRTHELPRATAVIKVVDTGPSAKPALAELAHIGRQAVPATDWTFADAPVPRGRLWSPTPFLEHRMTELGEPGSALDLACGTGRDAVYLAAHGWTLTAIDHDPSALQRGADLARRYAPRAEVNWIESDLERDPLPPRAFNLITCFRFMSRPLLARIPRMLAPGGHVLVEAFTPEHRARHGRPQKTERIAGLDEITALLCPLEIQSAKAGWREDAHTATVWARAAP